MARSRLIGRAQSWRQNYVAAFPIDAWDPLAHFVRGRLRWDWPQFLLFTFLIYGPIEKLVIPAIGGYLHLSGPATQWVPDVEALLTGFVEFPFFFAFYLWTGRGIGEAFVCLARNKSFADEERYLSFLRRAQAAFDRWWWPVVGVLAAGVAILMVHFVLWSPEAVVQPWFGAHNTFHRVLSLTLIGFVAYAVSQIVIREILAVTLLRLLWQQMGDDLVVRPYHPDDAGGLGGIGQHATSLAYFVMMVMLFIIMGALLPGLRGLNTITLEIWSPLLILMWVLYLIFVPLIFGLLIWPSHQTMRKARDAQLNELSQQLDERLAAAQASVATGGRDLADILKQIEGLKSMRKILTDDFPTWPINPEIRSQLRLSTLFPVAYSLLTYAIDLLT
jgi:hypothetical protein